MRPFSSFAATFTITALVAPIGCRSTGGTSMYYGQRGAPAKPDKRPSAFPEGGVDGSAAVHALAGPPTQLSLGSVSSSGVTTDGWAVFRAADVLKAAKIDGEPATQDITN